MRINRGLSRGSLWRTVRSLWRLKLMSTRLSPGLSQSETYSTGAIKPLLKRIKSTREVPDQFLASGTTSMGLSIWRQVLTLFSQVASLIPCKCLRREGLALKLMPMWVQNSHSFKGRSQVSSRTSPFSKELSQRSSMDPINRILSLSQWQATQRQQQASGSIPQVCKTTPSLLREALSTNQRTHPKKGRARYRE